MIINIEKNGPAYKAGLHPTNSVGTRLFLVTLPSEIADKKVQSDNDIRTEPPSKQGQKQHIQTTDQKPEDRAKEIDILELFLHD